LAERIQVTRRQLERLFRVHLDDTPSNFYLGLRLDKARQLLRQTDLSVLQVSLACGFESPSYFSRSYRARFAASPSQDRAVLPLKAPAATPPGAPAGHRTPRAERG
ncbi:HTH-type transcriptional regulator CdhR, partial [Pseudomonas aeruginosa]|nr:HTH-type transcriptional regulator CdhR [Pseudomonas aeruginosa]